MAINGTSGHRQLPASAQPGSSGSHFVTADELPPVSQELKLTCLACGQMGTYDIGRIFVSPDTHSCAEIKEGSEAEPVAFANYFHCANCGSPGPWKLVDYFKMLGISVRAGLSRSEGRISFGEMRLFDGTTIQTPALGERHLRRLLEQDPRSAFLHTRLGNLLRICGQTTRAAQSYRHALELDPDDLEARYHLFDFAADDGAIADAVLHSAQLARSFLSGRKHSSEEVTKGMAHAFVHAVRCAPHEFIVTFLKRGAGQIHFGCIEAELDWRPDDDAGRIAFTFAGFDEGDEIFGRGWAKAEGTALTGRIVIHQGDESGFQATKQQTRARPTKSRRR